MHRKGDSEAFAKAGARRAIADSEELVGREPIGDQAVLERARFVRCAVGKPKEVEALMETITAHEGRLDVLINNAGIMISRPPGDLP